MVEIHNLDEIKRRIDELNRQAILDDNLDTAAREKAFTDARQLAAQLNPPYTLGMAHTFIAEANWHYKQSNYLKVIYCVAQVETAYEKLDPDVHFLKSLYVSGLAFHYLGQTTEALEAHQQQADLARLLNAREWEASALRRIGVEHGTLGNNDLAYEYYRQSLSIYEHINEIGGVAGVLNNMAILFREKGEIDKAIEHAQRALQYFSKVDSKPGLAESNGQLGISYLAAKNYDLALKYVEIGHNHALELGALSFIIRLKMQLGMVYTAMHQYVLAQSMLLQALKLARDNNDMINESECLLNLSQMYEEMNDYGLALEYHKQYHESQIKLRDKASQSRFEMLEIQHQTKQAQIEVLTERQLRQQDRLYFEKLSHLKDEILSTASHDLKNPIASLMLVVHLLKKHGRLDDDRGLELLGRMDNGLNQMRKLITNLLDLARLDTGKSIVIDRHDIVQVMHQVVNTFALDAHEKQIKLNFTFDEDTMILNMDDVAIQQVVSNLLSNALKFTPSGGSVCVAVEYGSHEVIVSIEDTGVGIPAADLPRLFERFYRVQNDLSESVEGTGLGLAICKTIIEQHSGKIWVESESGKGSTFYFSLPAQSSPTK